MTDVHEHISTLIPAYAMGAVPEDEIPSIRAHILTCEECFQEAESYASALAMLAETVDPVPVSKGFADRVVASAVGPAQASAPIRRPRLFARRWRLGMAGATAAALIVTSSVMVASLGNERRYEQVLQALVRDPDALTLDGPGGARGLIASTDDGTLLVALELGEAPADRDYQLWLMKDGVPVPDATFDAGDDIAFVESDRSLDEYDGAAVTVEPEGGSEQPTTDPVLITEEVS